MSEEGTIGDLGELRIDSDVMDLGEEGDVTGDGQGFQQEPAFEEIAANVDSVRQFKLFLEHYGIDTSSMEPDEIVATYERISRLADEHVEVLSKGAVNDTLEKLLEQHIPPTHAGEFIFYTPERTTELDRAIAMGWEPVRDPKVSKESLTSGGDDLVKCGDLVLVKKPIEQYAALQIARERRHAARRSRRKAEQQNPSQGGQGIDPMGGNKLGAHPEHPLRPMEQLT